MSPEDRYNAAIRRLARVMAITQISMSSTPPRALFDLNLPALIDAAQDLENLRDTVPTNYLIKVEPQVIGTETAGVIADALATPVPDSPEGLT